MKNLAKKGFWGLIVVMFLSVTMAGCSSGLSKEKLEKLVATSIEETINSDNAYGIRAGDMVTSNIFSKFKVEKVTLIKTGENMYTGSATIIGTYKAETNKPKTLTENLTVIADKDSFQWKFE